MALNLVAIPIGNNQDVTLSALEVLNACEDIIVEERKEGTSFLRAHGISGKNYLQLNEHSTPADLKELVELCKNKNVALITDCGTPGFCDPGADLVRECRKQNIAVKTYVGASSLMGLLSLSSVRLDQFIFRGFLPAENEAREKAWQEVRREKKAFVLMDTPYRLQKLLSEIQSHLPERKMLLTLDLTQSTELVLEGKISEIMKNNIPKKAEFMILIYPS